MTKPIHVKPSYYAFCYYDLKEIAIKYGYNLVLHGSMNRDMDLIAIPWQKEVSPHEPMVDEFAEKLGGQILLQGGYKISTHYQSRIVYIINLNRTRINETEDAQYYLDISITPGNGIIK